MSKKRLLFVTQELKPYTDITSISELIQDLPLKANDEFDVRILMPRFGTINERRHRLHEVVRLSGMNIIVDDNDYPLIIKVASLPNARLQVYFLDNDEFFKRKYVFNDKDGKPFEDNPERMIFFCKGVIETVKKFGWPPDLIYCHGWMTSLVPMYVRKAYEADPLFQYSKIVYGAYNHLPSESFTEEFVEKASINELDEDDLQEYWSEGEPSLHSGAGRYADALVMGGKDLSDNLRTLYKGLDKPILSIDDDDDAFLQLNIEFLKSLVEEAEEETTE